MNEWNPNYETEEDGAINEPEGNKIEHKISRMVLDSIVEVTRTGIADMDPQERRAFCADLAASYSELCGNGTGRFFNAIAEGRDSEEADEKALGRRIMEKRNPNYHPKENSARSRI